MPPDRRSSGKQKRLHTLLRLICLRVLSTTGSVSVTPFPPCRPLSLHLIPPHLQSHPPPPTPTPYCCFAADPVIRARADVRGAHSCWGGGRRRRLIARQRLPPRWLWEPRTQPTSTQWPRTSTTETHVEVRMRG